MLLGEQRQCCLPQRSRCSLPKGHHHYFLKKVLKTFSSHTLSMTMICAGSIWGQHQSHAERSRLILPKTLVIPQHVAESLGCECNSDQSPIF
mmetsp:Transcript_60813/g.144912  ORF Transcript_60813/g.144912 Transcript_60813/m.144912 type:complete len:92 (-) Transcript_60813:32-307(-)